MKVQFTKLLSNGKALLLTAILASSLQSYACEICGKDSKTQQLHTVMQKLWADHMIWTYATVDAFYHNPTAVKPSLDRLLQNQKDIGAAIVPVYGQATGDKLAALLTTHINQAIPVLTAAKSGDKMALDKDHQHMVEMDTVLASGIIKQFPDKFKETKKKSK